MLKARGAQVNKEYHARSPFLHLDQVLLGLGVEKLKSRINIQAVSNQRGKRLLIATRDHWYIL